MDTLKFKRERLLESVSANREKHQQDYKDAVEGYRESTLEAIDSKIAFLQAEKRRLEAGNESCVGQQLGLTKPQQYLKDYDRVILMLEMSHEPEISLNHIEFSQYVMDDWKWKEQFSSTTALYNNKIGAARP